ncbi:hypothetical protein [Reinekea sp. G2M2-21]|uniref:hypothetical protein n=1 Tax=Reinekea sp. G2M2-21 TaxID=2788942 RepID=UPI0018AAFDD3|nr:hypothetical protein [Reinekea sp. G2M2-21]
MKLRSLFFLFRKKIRSVVYSTGHFISKIDIFGLKVNALILIFLMLVFPSKGIATQPVACGKEWINIHKGNPKLVGIFVSQLPDNIEDAKLYNNAHPVSIYYAFSDNMVHWVSYTPTGQVQDGRWYSAKESPWLKEVLTFEFKNDVTCRFWAE